MVTLGNPEELGLEDDDEQEERVDAERDGEEEDEDAEVAEVDEEAEEEEAERRHRERDDVSPALITGRGRSREEDEGEGETGDEVGDAAAVPRTGKRRAPEMERQVEPSKSKRRRGTALTLEQQEALAQKFLQQTALH